MQFTGPRARALGCPPDRCPQAADALPEAHELALGFEAEQRMSPGTAKTAIEALGKSGKIRRNGRIIDLPIGRGCRKIDFGRGTKLAMPIPWGDVATAFHTTGIPNITVFTPISSSLLALTRLLNAFGFFLRSRHVQTWLVERIVRRRVCAFLARRAEHPNTQARAREDVMFGCSDVYHWMGRTAKAVCLFKRSIGRSSVSKPSLGTLFIH